MQNIYKKSRLCHYYPTTIVALIASRKDNLHLLIMLYMLWKQYGKYWMTNSVGSLFLFSAAANISISSGVFLCVCVWVYVCVVVCMYRPESSYLRIFNLFLLSFFCYLSPFCNQFYCVFMAYLNKDFSCYFC